MVLSACSTGDGRTLREPVFPPPQTLAPEPTLPPEPAAGGPFELIAPWPDGGEIPIRHTCDGEDTAPALTWTNVPPDAVELAVTLVDLDANGYVHWVLYGIDPSVTSLIENEQPPPGYEWVNSAGVFSWSGPCPPVGEQHLYQFTVHALNQQLEVADDAPATEVIAMLNLIAIDQGAVAGTFVRTE
jgi:Raf kinase inhibitor-like YbhB/YbcL family protein